MKSPNVYKVQVVAKVIYAIDDIFPVVYIFSSYFVKTFKRTVEVTTENNYLSIYLYIDRWPFSNLQESSIIVMEANKR